MSRERGPGNKAKGNLKGGGGGGGIKGGGSLPLSALATTLIGISC